MNGKWYRKPVAKGVWILLVHLSLVAIVLEGFFLRSMGNMVTDFGKKSYIETSAYETELYTDSENILQALSRQKYLELNNENGRKNALNLKTGEIEAVKKSTGTSGELLYSLEDLKNWSESGIAYTYHPTDSETGILVFRTSEGGYHYYYTDDFLEKLESGNILPTFEDTDVPYQYSVTETEAVNEEGETAIRTEDTRILAILDSLRTEITENYYFSFGEWNIKQLYDIEEGLTYTDGWVYDSDMIVESYAPVGADDLLTIVNESDYWNGRLSEVYYELENTIYEILEAVSGEEMLKHFKEGNTNMTYVYVLPSQEKVYTNCEKYRSYSSYASTLKKIKESSSYIIIYPQLSKSSSTFDASLQDWQWMVSSFSDSEDEYAFMLSVDTEFPIADTLAEYNSSYQKNAGKIVPAIVITALALLVFLIGVVWLTVASGKTTQDEEIHLYALDHAFTELSAAAVFLLWLGGCSVVVLIYDEYSAYYSASSLEEVMQAVVLVILGLYTAALFLVGYLSLVRRIKAKILYEDSLLKWLLSLIKKCGAALKHLFGKLLPEFLSDVMEKARSEVRIILAFGGYLLLSLFLAALGAASGSAVFILILLLLDLAALGIFIRRAAGRQVILEGLRKITDGELEYKIPTEKLRGEQKCAAEYINRIGEGLDAAVENSLRNERMKTELITNVSHDIKTPLTSIINYIELLKRENFTDEKICGYLDVLDKKAQRLKTLTEDVVEASKASTGNISLEKMNLDMAEMVKQADGEFAEAFRSRNLQPVMNVPKEPVVVYVDGRRLWRVFANVYLNVSKYAMEGTRVYEDLIIKDKKAVFSIKNISAEPLNISPDELTERFIRGDGSRTTEGSGLGLSIAKSLTELQAGSFTLTLDGDLFKVTISFPLAS